MEQHIFSVTEVNELVKLLLDNEPMLSGICVRGEISNYKMYPSGHHYFSLIMTIMIFWQVPSSRMSAYLED